MSQQSKTSAHNVGDNIYVRLYNNDIFFGTKHHDHMKGYWLNIQAYMDGRYRGITPKLTKDSEERIQDLIDNHLAGSNQT